MGASLRATTCCCGDRCWHDGLMKTVLVLASLRDLHEGFAWVMVIGNGLAGVWALSAHRVEALRGRALWWFTALAQVAIAVQVTMGCLLYTSPSPRDKRQSRMPSSA